jgi:hypothetical protein
MEPAIEAIMLGARAAGSKITQAHQIPPRAARYNKFINADSR